MDEEATTDISESFTNYQPKRETEIPWEPFR